jgi:hypothetical protein
MEFLVFFGCRGRGIHHRGTEAQRRKSKKTGEAFNREICEIREQRKKLKC